MFRKSTQIKALSAVVAAIALAVPATTSANIDLRHPDNQYPEAYTQADQRNPEFLGPAQPASEPSREARFLGPAQPASEPSREAPQTYRPAQTPTTATQVTDSAGFSWGDAAIGAGVAFGLLIIGLTGMIAVGRRRGHGATA